MQPSTRSQKRSSEAEFSRFSPCGFPWISVENFAPEKRIVLFLPCFPVFQRPETPFHRTFPTGLDNHILPVRTVESFQNSFPQLVENSCGYVDQMRVFRYFSADFCRKRIFREPFFRKFRTKIRFSTFTDSFPHPFENKAGKSRISTSPTKKPSSAARSFRRYKMFPTNAPDRKTDRENPSEKYGIRKNRGTAPIFRIFDPILPILHPNCRNRLSVSRQISENSQQRKRRRNWT